MPQSKPKSWLRRGLISVTVLAAACVAVGVFLDQRYFYDAPPVDVSWQIENDAVSSLAASIVADVNANPLRIAAGLHVIAPSIGMDQTFVAGLADPASADPMRVDHQLRIASITKPYVAATALVLVERGIMALDAPLRDIVAPDYIAALGADGYNVDLITLEHLIAHRSGIPDYALHPRYLLQLVSNDLFGTQTIWTRQAQVDFAITHEDPLFQAGQDHSYSDTGYILLGDAIERATGQDLPTAVRTVLDFDRLGLKNTWWEKLEPRPDGARRAHQFWGRFDTSGMDPTVDLFGGGGLVADQRDLAHAMRAIVIGKVFANQGSIAFMKTPTHEPALVGDHAYGNGLYIYRFPQETCFGHDGFWGLIAVHCPDSDLTIALSYTQVNNGGTERNLELIHRALVQHLNTQ